MAFLDYTGLTTFWSKIKTILSNKQNALTAGEGVSLKNDTVSVIEPVKQVTQIEYDALTEEQKNTGLYIVTDANINLNDRGDVYSTEETRIGTWIDGKPLYRKVEKTRSPSTANKYETVCTIANLDAIISIQGYLIRDGNVTSPNLALCTDGSVAIGWVSSNQIVMYTSDRINYDMVLVIEYTKTTDPTPTVSSVSTQNLSVNSLNSASQSSEKVLTSKVPLPSHVVYFPASASASSAHFTFAPASASSSNLTLRGD